jgi:hypothetical protein
MFHLIGVDHRVQECRRNKITADNLTFANCLKEAIRTLRPTLVAEEHSVEALRGAISITCAIACSSGVQHAFCDPPAEWRDKHYRGEELLKTKVRDADSSKALSCYDVKVRAKAIEIAREFRKREEYWLDSIKTKDISTTVFVCGDAHVCSFRGLLLERGISSDVFSREIGVNEEMRKLIADAREYIRDNPDADVS